MTAETVGADPIEVMFVQTAQAMCSADQRLTLIGLADSTLYFSGWPVQAVGHMTSAQFLDAWSEGENSFAASPPSAVLSFLNPNADEPAEVVVVLHDPALRRDRFTYRVAVLDGTLPAAAGACVLFIHPPGQPLSPASMGGIEQKRPAPRRVRPAHERLRPADAAR